MLFMCCSFLSLTCSMFFEKIKQISCWFLFESDSPICLFFPRMPCFVSLKNLSEINLVARR